MFLVSLGIAVSGGTLHAEVHHVARVIAYIELLFAFCTVAALIAAFVRRFLLPGHRHETE
jgi:hypothetical protein